MQIPNQYNRQWRIDAGLLFFPVAAACGAMAVPLSVLAMTRSGWPSGLLGMAHGREMFLALPWRWWRVIYWVLCGRGVCMVSWRFGW